MSLCNMLSRATDLYNMLELFKHAVVLRNSAGWRTLIHLVFCEANRAGGGDIMRELIKRGTSKKDRKSVSPYSLLDEAPSLKPAAGPEVTNIMDIVLSHLHLQLNAPGFLIRRKASRHDAGCLISNSLQRSSDWKLFHFKKWNFLRLDLLSSDLKLAKQVKNNESSSE